MSLVKTSLVDRYNAQIAQCRQLQGGTAPTEVCFPVTKVEEYTDIYKNATKLIQTLQRQKRDNTAAEELRVAQAQIKEMTEARAKDKLEFEKAKQDGFTQLNDQLQKAYAQIQDMIKVQERYKAAIDKLREIINTQKEYYTTEAQAEFTTDYKRYDGFEKTIEKLQNEIARLTDELNNKSA